MAVSIRDLMAKGTGLMASVIIDADHNPAVTQAIALKVSVNHWIIGPVTATEPELSVLGQPVAVDNKTVLKGVAKASQLQVGDMVEVSGFAGFEPHTGQQSGMAERSCSLLETDRAGW